MAKTIVHDWNVDPATGFAVYGDEESGGLGYMRTHDPATWQMLREILVQLKMINIHLASMTEEQIINLDTEGLKT